MTARDILALIDDAPKTCLAALLLALPVLGAWAAIDRRTRAAAMLREAFRLSGWPGRTLVVVLAAAVLVVVAEDVLNRETEQLVLRLDAHARNMGRLVAAQPGARRAASLISRVTGVGLLGIVGGAAVLLATARRRRDAVVLVAGTLGAWLLANALKLAFAVRRPGGRTTVYEITGYGFPSGHALVTLVACGLLAWALGRRATHRARLVLYGLALAVAMLSSASRIVLTAHWASDVVAGLAIGMLWLVAVVVGASRDEKPALVAAPGPPAAPQ